MTENRIPLTQKDFTNISFIISQPGYYYLTEDIIFNPNHNDNLHPFDSGFPTPNQSLHPRFQLGFFAAVIIQSHHVTFDLNNFTLSQHPIHALKQRFFALLELASKPFLPNQGPHHFGDNFEPAHHLIIKNGTLGMNSHHCIHGNENHDVLIENVIFTDFEVAAISLNHASNITINKCQILQNRHDVPVKGIFSNAIFIRPYIKELLQTKSDAFLLPHLDISTINYQLDDLLKKTYDYVINKETKYYPYYDLIINQSGIIDGPSYGILIHSRGVAINGFAKKDEFRSKDIIITNNLIKGIHNHTIEIPVVNFNNKPCTDAIGAVFDFFNGSVINNKYIGNPILNAQIIVHKYKHLLKKNTSRSNLPDDFELFLNNQKTFDYPVFLGGDIMFHVNKGNFGIRIDSTNTVLIENNLFDNLKNFSPMGLTHPNSKPHPSNNLPDYGGCMNRGISIAYCKNTTILNNQFTNLHSSYSCNFAINIFLDSVYTTIFDNKITYLTNNNNLDINNYYNNPTTKPFCCGIEINKTNYINLLKNNQINHLHGFKNIPINII